MRCTADASSSPGPAGPSGWRSGEEKKDRIRKRIFCYILYYSEKYQYLSISSVGTSYDKFGYFKLKCFDLNGEYLSIITLCESSLYTAITDNLKRVGNKCTFDFNFLVMLRNFTRHGSAFDVRRSFIYILRIVPLSKPVTYEFKPIHLYS